MATYFARKAGNINASDVWATTPAGTAAAVTFAAGDILMANSFAITVNVSVNLGGAGQVRNDTNGGASQGGAFTLSDSITLTANVIAGSPAACVRYQGTSAANIVGDCLGGAGTGPHAAHNISTGTLNITGNVIGGSGNNQGARNDSTGIINITGNVTGGTGVNGQSWGVSNNSTGTINITGNVTAGTGLTAYGAFNNSTGIVSIIGTVTASQTAAGVAGSNVLQQTILSGPFITETTRGVAPVYCAAWRWNASPSNSTYMEVMTNNLLAKRSLYTADNITGMPEASNVKSGIAYGPSSELTGTFSQTVTPSTADIATAVWGAASRTITGGTVDTLTNAPASVTPSDIWSHASRTITGGTVTTLTNAPASVTPSDIWSHSSRTLTSASGPTAAEIRQEIDANSTKLDAAISSRMGASEATKLDAVKAKTDLLNTDRLSQVATTNIVGTLLAQANS